MHAPARVDKESAQFALARFDRTVPGERRTIGVVASGVSVVAKIDFARVDAYESKLKGNVPFRRVGHQEPEQEIDDDPREGGAQD